MHVPFSTTSSFLSNSKFHLSFRGQTSNKRPWCFFLGGEKGGGFSTATNVKSQGSNGTRGRITSIIIESLAFIGLSPRRNDNGRLESSFSELYFPPQGLAIKTSKGQVVVKRNRGGSFWLVKFLKKNPWHGCKKWANLEQRWFFCWSVLVMLLGDESETCWNDTIQI